MMMMMKIKMMMMMMGHFEKLELNSSHLKLCNLAG
jgi:hypothetical protein